MRRAPTVSLVSLLCLVVGWLTVAPAALRAVVPPQIAAGRYHSLFLDSTGRVWSVGANARGQLGDGTTTDRQSPVSVMTGVKAIAAGAYHSLFLKEDGTVWATGYNASGQLGDGSFTNRTSPVLVFSSVRSLSAGGFHSLFVREDATAWTVGDNWYGQLGNLSTTNLSVPVQVLTQVSYVSGGGSHSLFLRNDGTVWSCGYGLSGALGVSSGGIASLPTLVLSGVRAISAGNSHSLFVKSDDTVWGCGDNQDGRLGLASIGTFFTPVQILASVESASAGGKHSVFLMKDRTVRATGDNVFGQLGDGSTTTRFTPVTVLSGVSQISAGYAHSLAISDTAQVLATGPNSFGELADGTFNARTTYASTQWSATFAPVLLGALPSELHLVSGQTVVLNPQAVGGPLPTFQWRRQGAPIPGATGANYTLTVVDSAQSAGDYDCVATNAFGQVQTNVCSVYVYAGANLAIRRQPVSTSAAVGATATFSVTASSLQTVRYQWRRNGTALAGATSATLVLSPLSVGSAGSYTCLVYDDNEAVVSSAAVLTVVELPTIISQPLSTTVTAGSPVTFYVGATGTPAPSYQWYRNGLPISGATAPGYTILSTRVGDTASYQCVVSNSVGSVPSSLAVLTVEAGALTPYEQWASAVGLVAGSNDGVSQDPDGDGIENGAEFALGTHPLVRSPIPVRPGVVQRVGGAVATVTFPARTGAVFAGSSFLESGSIDGVGYRVFGSTDLSTWSQSVSELTVDERDVLAAGLPTLPSGWTYRSFGGPAGSARFFLKVEALAR